MLRKIFLGFLILLTVSAVSANDHEDVSTNDVEIDSVTNEQITLGEVGGSMQVTYTIKDSIDNEGSGSIQLVLYTDDGDLVALNDIEFMNVDGGQQYDVTFNDLNGDQLGTDNCGTNQVYMVIDDSYVDDYQTEEFTKSELFDGQQGEDGNLKDGYTNSVGTLTVEGGDCANINQEPNPDVSYAQGSSNIGAGTKIYLDASGSSDPDGEIVEYRWDIQGKDDITTSSPTGPSIKYTHPDESVSIGLTVEDNDGATSTTSTVLDVKETNYRTNSAGKYMYWVMNPSSPANYYYWYLSNVRWGVDGLNPEEPGSLILQDWDDDPIVGSNQDETAVYRGGSGDIVGDRSYMDNNDKNNLAHLISTDGQSKSNPSKLAGDQSYDWCSEQDGQDTSCHILEYEFDIHPLGSVEGTSGTGIPDKLANADDIERIGYIGGTPEYMNFPPGQLALGHAPNVFRNKDMNGQKIFALCRQSTGSNVNPLSDGMVIDMAPKTFNPDGTVDQEADLYRCDSYSDVTNGWRGELGGVWRPVSECNDGIDNDGDGTIDDSNAVDRPSDTQPDNDCTSPDDNSEASGGECTPVVTKTSTSEIVAYYGGGSDSNGYCDGSNGNSETFSDWTGSLNGVSSGNVPEPEVITCFEFEVQNLDQEDSNYCENRNFDAHDDDTEDSNSQVNFVKYYPTKTYYDEIINGEPVPTHFVNQNGFTEARMAIDNSGASGDGTKPAVRKGAENIYGSDSLGPHNGGYWLEDLGMVDEDGNGYTAGSYNDSWVVANAGAPDNPRVSTQFPGGYAGKCSEGSMWKFVTSGDQQRWQCSGDPDWSQAVFLPEIDASSDTIGMLVMPYNFREVNSDSNFEVRQNLGLTSWKTAYNQVPDQQADSDQTLNTMKVSCYPGDTTPDYSSAVEGTDYFNETVDIPGTDIDNPIGVYGEVDMGGLENQNYGCNWNYTTQNGEVVSSVGRVIQLQKSTSDVVDNFQNVKGNYTGQDAKEFPRGIKLQDKAYGAFEMKDMIDKFRVAEGLEALS